MIDQDLLSALQVALIEPPDGGASWPSGLWTRDEVTARLAERQDRLLLESLLQVGISAPITVLAGASRVDLPEDWIRTVSVVWTGVDGTVRELVRSTTFEADHLLQNWEATPAATVSPLGYIDGEIDHLQIQIAPAPGIDGTIEILYVPSAPPLTGNGEVVQLPNECLPGLHYGVLADLLGKAGRGADPDRAQYAEQRFQLTVDAARLILEGWS